MTEGSFASLSPTLLARKGGAKPAMRPQLAPIPDASTANLEDLGWNDMGGEEHANVVQLTPPSNDEAPAIRLASARTAAPAKRSAASKRGKRAAFTLRLDAQRHLKLRLAATIKGESAQQIVTDALDQLLAEIEDLDTLAAKMTRK
ncbi:hypothetical protein [Altererythrobacter litoralis]|uniref:Stability/partitioning determinant n=1 Tax=Altererythrobacter litoralis TaxID=3113904 RepID=A0ABU7GEN8_9SPHN|nr:hypothetical protein [Erythrobacteraceae bacterium 1XM1-14]